MRATFDIYEDPDIKSEEDVWTSERSKTTFYIVFTTSLAVLSALGFTFYQLVQSDTGVLGSLRLSRNRL
ncbi:unnamed protein product [Mycena citricolor]|uniref:Uncharacterized protein n=1 Tax=Mycena citricolor TaxID=2018698 RepID=A0AAD2Q1D4_9AGAR|nr:unnamed protein product [Mycena citricolor]